MKPLVSIIIPVYNVEKFLDNSINSALNQTYRNIEIILINDGSTDNSGTICDHYSNLDNRVKIKHIENNGVSNARNIGIDISNGEWILFLDSDDILELDVIEYIDKNKYDVDMILGNFKYVYGPNNINTTDNKFSLDRGLDLVYQYGYWKTKICMGSFAIKKSILDRKNIKFNTNTKYGEDVEFINYCLINSKYVRTIEQYFFNYIINNNSAIAKVTFERYDCYEARRRTLEYLSENIEINDKIIDLYENYLLPEAIIDTTYLLCTEGKSIIKIVKYLKLKGYYDYIESLKNNENIPMDIKKKINSFLFSPMLVWIECVWKRQYYNIRSRLGLIKRRILK